MVYFTRALALSAMLAFANGQIILMSAKGDSGTSQPLQLLNTDAKDSQIISDAEIKANVVNQCGRTALNGNIDIGQNTENAIKAGNVTKVKAGGTVEAMFAVKNNANPKISCDLDLTSNSNALTGQTKLKVKQQSAGNGQVKATISLPTDMKLVGASTGDIGTIRCRNAQNFGSCFAIQQTDVKPNVNDPATIKTAATLDSVLNTVAGNARAFKDVAAASAAAKDDSQQGTMVIDALLKANPDLVKAQAKAEADNAPGAKAGGNGGAAKGNGKGNGGARGNRKAGGKGNRGNRANGAGGRNNRANGAGGRNNRNNNKRDLEKRQAQLDRRATAMVALKWARAVLAEEQI